MPPCPLQVYAWVYLDGANANSYLIWQGRYRLLTTVKLPEQLAFSELQEYCLKSTLLDKELNARC